MPYVFAQVMLLLQAEPATGSEGGGAGLLLPAPEELIAGLIAFAIVFFFVWKWAIPALNQTLDARRAAIKGEYEAAERAKQEAEGLLADYRTQVAGAREEAARIIDEARASGEAVKADIIARAEAEAEQIRRRAHEEIGAERERVAAELKRQVADLAIQIAGRLVADSLDEQRQRELVDRYIDELGGVH